jgi:hypothetical protein
MVILAGLVLAAGRVLFASAAKTRTRAILAVVQVGLGTSAAQRGSAPAPAPHPLCGSAEPRLTMLRDGSIAGYASGSAVGSGIALRVANPATIASGDRSRVLLPSDRFQGASNIADCPLPLLYGAERSTLSLLSTGAGISHYRKLPQPSLRFDRNRDGMLDTPYSAPLYPDTQCLVDMRGLGRALETERVIHSTLDASQLEELAQLDGLTSASTADLAGGLLSTRSGTAPLTYWESGRYHDGSAWREYYLTGTSIVDAWGNEVFYWLTADGARSIVTSAGPDGVLRWHPGNDGRMQTPVTATSPSGDDRDGAKDNLSEGLQ